MATVKTAARGMQFSKSPVCEQAVEAAHEDAQSTVTTLMIRNLPRHLTQLSFISELNKAGFEGLFDFAYVPQSFHTNENAGFAFVNFISPCQAGALVGLWHGQRLFGADKTHAALNISPADVQGLTMNIQRWTSSRLRRIRDPNLRPFVLDERTKTLRSLTNNEVASCVNPCEALQ